MRTQVSVTLLLALGLNGCLALDDYDYEGYEIDLAACRNDECTWSKRIGDDSDQRPRAATLDDAGNVFVAGIFNGRLDLDEDSFVTAQALINSPYVAEYDAFGKPKCIHSLPAGVGGGALAVTNAGSTVIWGGYTDPDGNGGAFIRIDDVCNPPTPIYTNLTGTGMGRVTDLVLSDDFAKVYAAGTVLGLGEMDCKVAKISFDTVDYHLFVAELDVQTGACNWARVYGGGYHAADSIRMVKGGANHLILAGSYIGGIDGSTIPMESIGGTFVISVEMNDGDVVAANAFRAANNSGIEEVRLNALTTAGDQVIIVGENNSATMVDIGDAPVHAVSSSAIDSFVIGLDPTTLAKKWAYLLGGANGQQVTSVASAGPEHVFLAGIFETEMILEGKEDEPFACDAPRCPFLAKLSGITETPEVASFTILGRNEMRADATTLVAANAAGLVLATGSATEITAMPENPLPPVGLISDLDVVISKFFPVP